MKYLVIGKPEHGSEGRYHIWGTVEAGSIDLATERAIEKFGRDGYYNVSDFIVVDFDASGL